MNEIEDNSRMENLKIVFIQHTTEVGGSFVSLYNTIKGIQKHNPNFQITILCKDKNIYNLYKKKGINAFYFPLIGFLGHCTGCTYKLTNPINLYSLIKQLFLLPIFTLAQYFTLRDISCDIVHLNSSVLLSSALAAKLAGKKVVWHIREVISEGNFGIRKKILSYFIKLLSNKVIAISPFEASALESCFNFQEKMEVVYNFIDFNEFNYNLYNLTEEREKLNIPSHARVVLSLGGFNPIKGSKELLDALPNLNKDIHVAFAGENKSNWDSGYSLGENRSKVHILGPTHDVPKLISLADIIYFGGTIPHFPRPIYEAWALKKPIIAFNINGVKQNVIHNKNGYLIDNISGKDLAKSINFLLNKQNEKNLQKMGESGYIRAREKFDINKNIKKILEIYFLVSR